LHVTRYEESLLQGHEGEAVEKAMRLLVTLGDVFGADSLLEVGSSHVSGVSYMNLGDAGLGYLKDQAALSGKARIRATLNPAGMDLERWGDLGVPEGFARKQLDVISAFASMGVETSCTCTPYYIGNTPAYGEQIAWAESSAISFANSVLGARTNRETGPTSLASALTGRAANYGYRLWENRLPTGVVDVIDSPKSLLEYSLLGYSLGELLGNGIPYMRNLVPSSPRQLKSLGAAAATSGGIALYHVEGYTPESRVIQKEDFTSLERFSVDRSMTHEVLSKLSGEVDDPILCLGCPHLSLEEVQSVATVLQGRRLSKRLWVFVSRGVYYKAKGLGLVDAIESAGGKVFKDTCMVVAPLEEMGVSEVQTNSCKAARYLLNRGVSVALSDAETMLLESLR